MDYFPSIDFALNTVRDCYLVYSLNSFGTRLEFVWNSLGTRLESNQDHTTIMSTAAIEDQRSPSLEDGEVVEENDSPETADVNDQEVRFHSLFRLLLLRLFVCLFV